MQDKICAVYILANERNTVLYTGVTSNLPRRLWQHRNAWDRMSFTSRYNVKKLVWYETAPNIRAAITREKQIKAGSRQKKESLITAINPEWRDLSEGLLAGKAPS